MNSPALFPPSSRLGEVKEYYFSTKLRELAQRAAAGQRIINLGIGSPDLPPHPAVIQALTEAAADPTNHAYQSYNGIPELRRAFADWYRTYFNVTLDPAGEVLPLLGSKEGIMHLSMAFLDPGDEVLLPDPGYPTYRAVTDLAGGVARPYQLSAATGWYPDLAALETRPLDRVKIMWINYPHMPTGTPADPARLAELVAFARRHRILLVNDNPYAFLLTERPVSILAVPGAAGVALELNSLSKAHNMAGWRVGALLGDADLLKVVLRFKSNMDSGMFKPVQLAAARALGLGPAWYAAQNDAYRTRRELVYRLFDHLGIRYTSDQVGLFVWGRVPAEFADGYAMSDLILDETGVFITPGGIFGPAGTDFVRVSLCSPPEVLTLALEKTAALTLIPK